MTAIDYAKYADMNAKQLVHLLENAKKQKRKFQAQVKNVDNLIKFLSNKINAQKYDFVEYKKSKSYKLAQEYEKTLTQKEIARLKQELRDEINRNYGNDL